MDVKSTDEKGPPADSPDTDSARSTPEVGAEAQGAIPKSRSMGRLESLRSSLRDVGKNSSFKLGRKKKEDGAKEEKKKSKKTKNKEAKPPEVAARPETPESVGGALTSPALSASAESLPAKTSKASRASSLVRRLSLGRYRGGKKQSQDSPVAKTLSPSSTSPELSPAASRTDVSDDEAPSVASSTSESRQGPEGDDSEVFSPPSSASPSPVQPPLPAVALGQSRLIAGGTNKGPADQSQAPASRGAAASAASARQASRKDRDSALESVPEAESHEEAAAPPVEVQGSPPSPPSPPPPPPSPPPPPPSPPALSLPVVSLTEAAPRSPLSPLHEDGAAGSSRVATAVFMSQRLGSAAAAAAATTSTAVDVATTKSQILSITTPAIKKQQALDEIRAASVAAPAPPAASARPPGAVILD